MLKFFGISKKDKITLEDTANIFSVALNKVIDDGFPEIQSFFNKNNNLEKSPNILEEDIKSFRLIIFTGNLYLLSTNFEESETLKLRNQILDNLLPSLDKDNEVAMDVFLNYETYYNEILKNQADAIQTMAIAIFDKYNINDCQSSLLQRKNEPNPIIFNELKHLLKHFIWNWDEFLEKCKITF